MIDKSRMILKKILKKGVLLVKGAIASNGYTHSLAQKIKRLVIEEPDRPEEIYDYQKFFPTIKEYKNQLDSERKFKNRPLISIVMPTYNTNSEFLRECIDSVIMQSYPKWELCIADDCSSNKEVEEVLKEYKSKDRRIRVVFREENGHISEASNSAINIAKGDFIALLDHDDVLWPNALYEVVVKINEHPDADLIYTDEDKIDSEGKIHSYPFFKPEWSPEFLESCNYITHFSCIRSRILKEVNGFRVGYEGAQDWDLFIRLTEKTNKIFHIPKVLYSWRVHETSTAKDTDAKPYVYKAQSSLLQDHIQRLGRKGEVTQGIIRQHKTIIYDIEDGNFVDVIIVARSRDYFVESFESVAYPSDIVRKIFVLHDNNADIVKYCSSSGLSEKIELVDTSDRSPHLAGKYNYGVQRAVADYVLFLNDSVKLRGDKPIERLLSDVQNNQVGVVGCRRLDRSGKKNISAGIGLGVGGLFTNLFSGIYLEDNHYLRSLYGNSRRNVLALDSGCLMVSRKIVEDVNGFDEKMGDLAFTDFCLKTYEEGKRNVYTPFVQSTETGPSKEASIPDGVLPSEKLRFKNRWSRYIENDPYVNPNFSKDTSRLNLKQ